MRPEASPSCPSCGSAQVARVVYGLPDLERLRPDLEAGRAILGGCCLSDDSTQWKCQACGHDWGRPEVLDELHRLRREAEALPKGPWRRLQSWIGVSLEDEKTILSGLARRLAWATIGVAVVLLMAPVISPWVGLAVLVIWFLPLLWHIVLRLLAVVFGIGMLALMPWNKRTINGSATVLGFTVLTFLEMIVLILAFAYTGGWLLSEAMAT